MSYNLFLDDERQPKHCRDYPGDESIYDTAEFKLALSYGDFINVIEENGIPNFVSFDYNILGPKTGLDCAEYLKKECEKQNVKFPAYRVHSSWPGIHAEFYKLIEEKQGEPEKF
ncbi:MAG: cyclic-phosphate processing receiver domain-containing protein [Candidatus Pacearchaeota archaeon]|jgi:hypothetical protein|nr:hypothetical protein [Clostridia bacterium]